MNASLSEDEVGAGAGAGVDVDTGASAGAAAGAGAGAGDGDLESHLDAHTAASSNSSWSDGSDSPIGNVSIWLKLVDFY